MFYIAEDMVYLAGPQAESKLVYKLNLMIYKKRPSQKNISVDQTRKFFLIQTHILLFLLMCIIPQWGVPVLKYIGLTLIQY